MCVSTTRSAAEFASTAFVSPVAAGEVDWLAERQPATALLVHVIKKFLRSLGLRMVDSNLISMDSGRPLHPFYTEMSQRDIH